MRKAVCGKLYRLELKELWHAELGALGRAELRGRKSFACVNLCFPDFG